MAESVLGFAVQKLNDFLTKEAYFLEGVDERVRSLRTKLEWMRAFLEDVHGKHTASKRFKLWVAQIREVAYDAEDVIDSYIYSIEQQRGETSAGFMRNLRSSARRIRDIPTIRDIVKKIGDIERRLDNIKENRSEYGIDNIPASTEASSSSNQSQVQGVKRAPIAEEADVVGVEDETGKLVERLIKGDDRRAVISITGMGGIGKTTLARKVYNDIDVKMRFNFRAWVYVSQEFRRREILLSIINCFTSLSRHEMERAAEEDLRRKLSKHLEVGRYLVVIDDIWSGEAWDGLVTAFPDRRKGSRVLLTTRNEDVAKHADARSTPHRVRFLNQSESWALFCKKALPGDPAPPCPPNLEELGRKMVGKCEGLPLAIAVLGGVLSRKDKSVNEWNKVLKSVVWWLHESKDGISGILALSYHDLPFYLKPCFLYLGAFPEDSEIDVPMLLKLWIAEGFVQQRGEEEMEDVAEDCLNELISRSMLQVSRRESNGTVGTCRIHDLLRDLSISEAKEERFLDVCDVEPTSATTARRLAITSGDINKCVSLNRSTPHLRSLLQLNPNPEVWRDLQFEILYRAFKLLRVMNLQYVYLTSLPDEIGYLIHLRYLRLHVKGLKSIPSTITRLSNLQTLDLKQTDIEMLPGDISKMERLRHLFVPSKLGFSEHSTLHRLSNLQTLQLVKAESWMEDGLEKLTNLRDLGIIGDLEMALFPSLCKLVHLRSLTLIASNEGSIPAFESFSNHHHLYKMALVGFLENLPEPHVFPPNLTELYLYGSELDVDPMRTLEKLPNLRALSLGGYEVECETQVYMGKEMVCSVGGFPLLDKLIIAEMDEIEEWVVEKGAMPNLRSLSIYVCRGLKMLPDGLQHVTTLQELQLVEMPEEFTKRVKENEGEDWLKIRHIPSVTIA